MMGKYIVKSDRAQVVTGLGVFSKGEEREFTDAEAEGFQRITGLELNKDNVPEGVTVTKRGGRSADTEEDKNA
jgi:hypothetical protein